MPLQQGPFIMLDEDAAAVAPGVYDFEADAIKLGDKLQAISLGWNDVFTDLDAMASDPLDDLTSINFLGLFVGLTSGSTAAALPSLDDAMVSYDLADTQLKQALTFAPPDAYRDPPGPFVPPSSALDLTTPEIPVSAFSPATLGYVGQLSTGLGHDVQLLNLTRFGAHAFVQGDQFRVLVEGTPGQVVTVNAQKNGINFGLGTLGTVDGYGQLMVDGTMGPEFVGTWIYDVYLDAVLTRQFNFIVTGAL